MEGVECYPVFGLGAVGIGGENDESGGEDAGEEDSLWAYEAVVFHGVVTLV